MIKAGILFAVFLFQASPAATSRRHANLPIFSTVRPIQSAMPVPMAKKVATVSTMKSTTVDQKNSVSWRMPKMKIPETNDKSTKPPKNSKGTIEKTPRAHRDRDKKG